MEQVTQGRTSTWVNGGRMTCRKVSKTEHRDQMAWARVRYRCKCVIIRRCRCMVNRRDDISASEVMDGGRPGVEEVAYMGNEKNGCIS